jgi:hypothetical protein
MVPDPLILFSFCRTAGSFSLLEFSLIGFLFTYGLTSQPEGQLHIEHEKGKKTRQFLMFKQ